MQITSDPQKTHQLTPAANELRGNKSMTRSHLIRRIEAPRARQVAATGLVLSVLAFPATALAQSGLIGGLVGGVISQGFQPQPPQYYQPPPQQYYPPPTQQYYPPQPPQANQQQLPPANTQQLQQTNQQSNDQFLRDEEDAERLRQKRVAVVAAKKAKTENPLDKPQNVAADKVPNPPAEQKGRDDVTLVSATTSVPLITTAPPATTAVQPAAAVQPSVTTLPAFPDQASYADARSRLIALGYGPLPSGSQQCDPAKDASCYPEREFCFGSTVIQCNFSWKQGNTVIRVQTANLPPTITKIECLENCQ